MKPSIRSAAAISPLAKLSLIASAAAATAALASGCMMMGPSRPVATAVDLQRLGTRAYPGRSPDQVAQASLTALKVLGYEVVTSSPRIRTAPKDVATTAAGTYSQTAGTARSFTEAVAWDIDVEANGQGATLHATPRASVNGQPMEQVYVEWAERNFAQLMKEIDASFSTN